MTAGALRAHRGRPAPGVGREPSRGASWRKRPKIPKDKQNGGKECSRAKRQIRPRGRRVHRLRRRKKEGRMRLSGRDLRFEEKQVLGESLMVKGRREAWRCFKDCEHLAGGMHLF